MTSGARDGHLRPGEPGRPRFDWPPGGSGRPSPSRWCGYPTGATTGRWGRGSRTRRSTPVGALVATCTGAGQRQPFASTVSPSLPLALDRGARLADLL